MIHKNTFGESKRDLDPGFNVEIDEVTKKEWSSIIQLFNDATLYQTWDYGQHAWGENNLSHIVLKKDGQIVAAAQLRIYTFPIFKRGFAHISWGPMWKKDSEKHSFLVFHNLLRALKNYYSDHKKLLLRIRLNEIDNGENENLSDVLTDEGFVFNKKQYQYRSMRLNLDLSLEDIRRNLRKKWRQYLNKSERQNIEVLSGFNGKLFKDVCQIHTEMVKRKKYSRYVTDSNKLAKTQHDLPEELKMKTFLGVHKNQAIGGLAVCSIGKTAMPMLSAISETSINAKIYVSYLLHWRMIIWLKENNLKYLDLRGYSPESFSGPSFFKEGLKGEEIRFMGTYEAVGSHVSKIMVRLGEWMDLSLQHSKCFINNLKPNI